MADSHVPPATGLLASLRRAVDTGLELAQVRLALLGTELEEQKLRIASGLALGALGILATAVGTVLLCGLILLLAGEAYRLTALVVLTLLFLAGGALLVAAATRRLHSAGSMFQASVHELKQDWATVHRSSVPPASSGGGTGQPR